MDIEGFLELVAPSSSAFATRQADGITLVSLLHRGVEVSYPTAELAVSENTAPDELADRLITAPWAPRTRKDSPDVLKTLGITSSPGLSADACLSRLVERGWLVRWTTLTRRGTVAERVSYGLGPATLEARILNEVTTAEAVRAEQASLLDLVNGLDNPHHHPGFEVLRTLSRSGELPLDDLRFMAAVLLVSSRLDIFDWKEIGAYFLRSGARHPSKQFDSRKDRYLQLLRQHLAGGSLNQIGLDTLPEMPVVFFSGDLAICWPDLPTRVFAHTPWAEAVAGDGVGHAVAIKHSATTVVAVENRAVLRRLARHYASPNRTDLIFVAYEGQVRTHHLRFLELLAVGGARRLIMWGDCDVYALSMLDKLRQLPYAVHEVIVPPGVRLPFMEGRQQLARATETASLYEQERDIGHRSLWERLLGGLTG